MDYLSKVLEPYRVQCSCNTLLYPIWVHGTFRHGFPMDVATNQGSRAFGDCGLCIFGFLNFQTTTKMGFGFGAGGGYAFMHAFRHAFMNAFMHSCMHSCVHACIHAYIYIYMYLLRVLEPSNNDENGLWFWSWLGVGMHACIHACMRACMYVCLHMRMWVHSTNIHIVFPARSKERRGLLRDERAGGAKPHRNLL